ncbi:transmembrane protein 276-like [Crassostrea virginica]
MARQISTALSDLLLCIVAFYVSYKWYHANRMKAAVGISIQATAAFLGIFRFAMSNPEGGIIYKSHKFMSWLAAGAGVPLIAMDFCARYESAMLANKIAIFLLAVVVVAAFLPPKTQEVATQAASGFSMLVILILCFIHKNYLGLGAGVTYVVAGLVFSSEGSILGLPKVDWLHYALIMGNYLFLRSI